MSSNIKISRMCLCCGTEFIARITVTKFCSHKCASKDYKRRQREKKISKSNEETQELKIQPIFDAKEKEERIQREIRWAKQKEQERIGKALEARKKLELDDVKNLFNESTSWHKSTILNNFIKEVEKRAIETNTLTEELQNCLAWAKQKADWYNPFIKYHGNNSSMLSRLYREKRDI